MLKKWLLSGALALALLGLWVPWWWPRLLDLAGTQSARIQGLASLVQIVLWLCAAAVALPRLWFRRGPRGDIQGNVNVPSIERLEVHVEVPEAGDFLRRLGLGAPLPDLEEAARLYLQVLVDTYRYLDLRGMGISDRVALKLPLLGGSRFGVP